MGKLKRTGLLLSALGSLAAVSGEAWARQNILIGELSVGYDYQNRTYKDGTGNNSANDGDARNYLASPRIRFSSRDVDDLLEFTYAPTFTYDDLYNSSFVGQDADVRYEKSITHDWRIQAADSYFYGEDSITDLTRQRAAIIPGTETSQPTGTGAEARSDNIQSLSDVYGRQRYWRNDFRVRTDYTYAKDSVVGIGYNYGILRYTGDTTYYGDSDYDRHEAVGRLSYRFNTQWSAESEFNYVRGTYDQNASVVDQYNSDLDEYHGMLRANYAWQRHDILFGRYAAVKTVYDDPQREGATVHDFTLGWDHDFSRDLRMTLSAGPTIVVYENGGSESGTNAFAGLNWNIDQRAKVAAHTAYSYEFDNFDGRQTGLAKTWRSELEGSYQLTPQTLARLITGYEKRDHETSNGLTTASTVDRFNYTEKTYDAGLALRYTFLRWYSLEASYRYADHSEPLEKYDEHRVLLTLTATQDLLHW